MDALKARIRKLLDPLTLLVARMGIHPAFLTMLGLAFSVVAGIAYAKGRFPLGGVLLLLAGLCDMTDGPVARATGKGSSFGAFLDSSIDRYSELWVYLGLGMYFFQVQRIEWVAVFLAFSGSLMVSYTRARAEGLGEDCRIGWVQRPERLTILIIASLFGIEVTGWILWGLAGLAHLTAAQRIRHVYLLTHKTDLREQRSGSGTEK